MSDLGDDINEVHAEVGNSFGLVRSGQAINTGEYLIPKINRQVTKPFIREFFLEASFDWDSVTQAGDIVQLNDGRDFMVMNLTPVMFQDETIEKVGTLYKCNVSGQIMRPSETEGWDADYREVGSFTQVSQNVYALQTEALYGHKLDLGSELGELGLENHELYLPASSGIKVFDRYQPVSGEYYKVETIKKRRFDNVWVCEISEDTR